MLNMLDERGYTLMHVACLKNDEEMVFKLMERVYQRYDQPKITEWLNIKTKEDGFTALHFASFRGNL